MEYPDLVLDNLVGACLGGRLSPRPHPLLHRVEPVCLYLAAATMKTDTWMVKVSVFITVLKAQKYMCTIVDLANRVRVCTISHGSFEKRV